jgi:hypothetical protein
MVSESILSRVGHQDHPARRRLHQVREQSADQEVAREVVEDERPLEPLVGRLRDQREDPGTHHQRVESTDGRGDPVGRRRCLAE